MPETIGIFWSEGDALAVDGLSELGYRVKKVIYASEALTGNSYLDDSGWSE